MAEDFADGGGGLEINLNCKLFGLKGIIFSRDIFDNYSIIKEVNPELRGFLKFTKRSLSLQIDSF